MASEVLQTAPPGTRSLRNSKGVDEENMSQSARNSSNWIPLENQQENTMTATPKQQESNEVVQQSKPARTGLKLVLLITALCLAVFCQALDNTIIATAIPRITDEFNSLDDIGWYASGYLLTTCAFQLSYGKLYNLFPTKWVFLASLAIFELGSVVCGAAPSSVGLIMGRVVAGIGSGGIFSGAVLIIAASLPLEKRPIFNGMLGAMYAVASIAGPLLGGVFTDRVTWRLCFYIDLPFGLVTAICVMFFLSSKDGYKPTFDQPLKEKAKSLDIPGLLLFIPTIVCLLLALQWGGSTYAWKDARIIVLFILSALLFAGFVGVQIWEGDRATVPPSVIRKRTVWACCLFLFFLFGSFLAFVYYIPIWFQAIKGVSATHSGIDNLPSILGTVTMSLIAGGMVAGIGYYTWACMTSSVLSAIGAGLCSTFTPSTRAPLWIGYQILYGAGCGIGFQQPLIAVQNVLPEEQVSEGTAILIFTQTFGGAIFVAVAQNVFNNQLVQNVLEQHIPVNPEELLSEGATRLTSLVDPAYLVLLRVAYNDAITQTFYVSVATAGLSIIGSALIPWYSIKKKDSQKGSQEVDK